MASASKRYYFLDALRSILMMLGVVMHTAKIYDVARNWDIEDQRTSIAMEWLAQGIHLFRMPAFFIISGFFTLFTLQKYGSRHFLRLRRERLLVPLVATALLLNSLQGYVIHCHLSPGPLGLLTYLRHQLPQAWRHGDWVVHLWFLNNLLLYSLLAALFYSLRPVGQRLVGWRMWPNWAARDHIPWLLLALGLLAVGLRFPAYTWPLYSQRFMGITSLNELVEYLPYFLFGMWLYRDRELLHSFSQARAWQVGAFAAAAALLWLSFAEQNLAEKIIFNFSRGVLTWLACLFCFALFRHYWDQPSPVFLYLADASYTVYLFHHLCVVLLGLWLLPFSLSIYLKFIIIVSMTLTSTLLIHHYLILRIGILRFLFNGKHLNRVVRSNLDQGATERVATRQESDELSVAVSGQSFPPAGG